MAEITKRKLTSLKKLPDNPRNMRAEDMAVLVDSLARNPELFAARPIILSDGTGELVIIAGNMRFEAAKSLGIKEVPTILLPGLTEAKEREIAIRDNINNGDWDWDLLANQWDDLPLAEWGLQVPTFDVVDDMGEEFNLPEGDREPFQQMTFTFADEQANAIKEAIKEAQALEAFKYEPMFGNENSNGNGLYLIVTQWFQQKN
jgi:hypothetical protein